MREYIINLTNNLINKNRYDVYPLNNDFIEHVKSDLELSDVNAMNPGTLGKILCSLEIGDVMASKKDLFGAIHFSGECEEMPREIVALCLAYVIRDRLDPHRPSTIPIYKVRRNMEGGRFGRRLSKILSKIPDVGLRPSQTSGNEES